MKTGIYKIESPTKKVYIGSSVNIAQRWRKYKSLNCQSQRKLYNSFVKYGVENHKFSIIIECDRNELFEYEHLYSNYYNVLSNKGLNCMIAGFNDVVMQKSKETIELHKSKIIGKKQTQEHQEKKRVAMLGRKHSPEAIEKMKNRKISEFTRQKLREKNQKLILNLDSGVFYTSLIEASFAHNICKGNLSSMLNGNRRNKTNLTYL